MAQIKDYRAPNSLQEALGSIHTHTQKSQIELSSFPDNCCLGFLEHLFHIGNFITPPHSLSPT